jgi:glycosyltransferase involved in cell wall biosynthesis
MKLAFLFGPIPTGARPLDLRVADESPRGLTGTDNSFVGYLRAMAARGHDVHAYILGHAPCRVNGVHVHAYEDRLRIDASFDAVLSWCDADALESAPASAVRFIDQQLNNFDGAHTRHETFVDVYAAPSSALAGRLASMMGAPDRWVVLPNGCDPGAYDLTAKVPGRCIYASSPDRGLNVALAMWPEVRRAVPHATLQIFYHSMQHWFDGIDENSRNPCHSNQEHARRAFFCKFAIPHLKDQGVEHIGSVSRIEMARAYSDAMVLAYPCDTISWTEGFGVAVLEGCASGAIPVVSSADAFGEVYGGSCPMVDTPTWDHRQQWADMVIRSLTDEAWRADWVARGRALAAKHAWPVLGERLERVLAEAKAKKS